MDDLPSLSRPSVLTIFELPGSYCESAGRQWQASPSASVCHATSTTPSLSGTAIYTKFGAMERGLTTQRDKATQNSSCDRKIKQFVTMRSLSHYVMPRLDMFGSNSKASRSKQERSLGAQNPSSCSQSSEEKGVA